MSIERQIASNHPEHGRSADEPKSSGKVGAGAGAKRKYRRHPKVLTDHHAHAALLRSVMGFGSKVESN